MSRLTTGRVGWCVGLAVVLLGPTLAQAQLFPNLPIKRQRPSMDEEAPVYGTYRRQFYGYYPTCWRRFPAGWGCPTPEAIDWNTIQREDPVRMRRDLEAILPRPANDPGAAGPAAGVPGVPAVPDNPTSPFDTPAPPAGGEPPAPAPGATPVPPAGGGRSPFDLGPGQTNGSPAPEATPAAYRPEQPAAARPRNGLGLLRRNVEVSLNDDAGRRRR